ncbi:MAG: glycosyltransferase [Candidatus Anammoxibacter sp.]
MDNNVTAKKKVTCGISNKTLYISPQPLYEDRGTPIAIYEELKVLSNLGFEVDVATYPVGEDVTLPGIRLVRTMNPLRFKSVPVSLSFKKILLDIFLVITVFRLASKTQYSCVHGVEEGAVIALACKVFFGIPVIYDMHSRLPAQLATVRGLKSGPARWIALQFEKLLIGWVDVILASRGLASHVYNIDPKKPIWEYIFDGLDYSREDKSLTAQIEYSKGNTIVYTGNFSIYQGLELLIESVKFVRMQIPDVTCVLVGGTESEIRYISGLIENSGLADNFKLYQRVARSKVVSFLAIADALVLPRPNGENVPLKIFDYMKSGKPIVATDIAAHISILTEHTSILVKPNAKAIADGLLVALRDKNRANNIAINAAKMIKSKSVFSLKDAIRKAYGCAINIRKAE